MSELKKKLTNPEVIRYLIFGVLTTILSLAIYYGLQWFGIDYKIAHGISWVAAVLFAYVTNKIFVFESKSVEPLLLIREIVSFFACRLLSGVVETVLLIVMVEWLLISSSIAKIVTQVIVVILNYIFSKLIIFRKKQESTL